MFIFAIFVQKFDFVQSHFQKLGVALPEIYLFQLLLFWVLGKCCFKGAKVLLDECFFH